jgi:hypothetical protein
VGIREELPMITFTSADVGNHGTNPPSAGYLRTMVLGLRESHGWTDSRISQYLTQFPGVAGAWSTAAIEDLVV